MTEALDEELQIMEERSRPPASFSADALAQPIGRLCDRPVLTLDVSATVREATALMRERSIGAVVITRGGRTSGIVTERDLMMKVIAHGDDLQSRPVTDIMTPDPDRLRKEDPIKYVMNQMHVGGYRHVPIVDDDDIPQHIISIRDVMAFILDHFDNEISNIPPEPFRGPPSPYG